MTSQAAFVKRQWRYSLWFLRLFPIWILLIAGINIWDDHRQGNAFTWSNDFFPLATIRFASVIYIWMQLIFKFVPRYSQYGDKNSLR